MLEVNSSAISLSCASSLPNGCEELLLTDEGGAADAGDSDSRDATDSWRLDCACGFMATRDTDRLWLRTCAFTLCEVAREGICGDEM